MEPDRSTDPALLEILKELSAREPIFHHPEYANSRADFEQMTMEDFWEVGASGLRYSREYVLDTLTNRELTEQERSWKADDFQCRRLSEDTYLLTYTLLQHNDRLTRRATIWRRCSDGWKVVYHQGTAVSKEALSKG